MRGPQDQVRVVPTSRHQPKARSLRVRSKIWPVEAVSQLHCSKIRLSRSKTGAQRAPERGKQPYLCRARAEARTLPQLAIHLRPPLSALFKPCLGIGNHVLRIRGREVELLVPALHVPHRRVVSHQGHRGGDVQVDSDVALVALHLNIVLSDMIYIYISYR